MPSYFLGLDGSSLHVDNCIVALKQSPIESATMPTPFKLVTDLLPAGNQSRAIDELVAGITRGDQAQVLLGITGSGKTFTMAHVVERVRPTLVVAHNKTLAHQLFGEFKDLLPDNAVHFFVSYYDYYQPEAYVPSTTRTSRRIRSSTKRSIACGTRRPTLF